MSTNENVPRQLTRLLRKEFGFVPKASDIALIKQGGWCNANIYQIEVDGRSLAIKEFYSRHALVAGCVGRLAIGRETRVLSALEGIPGVVTGARRLAPAAMVMDYVDGQTLAELRKQGRRLPVSFFEQLEDCLEAIHRRGFVHLDLRNMGNVICTADGRPCLIDFPSYLPTRYLPMSIRKKLEEIDYSGVFKGWKRVCDKPLDPVRADRFERIQQRRKFWIFEGYFLGKFLDRQVFPRLRALRDAVMGKKGTASDAEESQDCGTSADAHMKPTDERALEENQKDTAR